VLARRILGASWRAVRHAPDRAFHALRRRAAAARVRGKVPRSVLFICYGNVCRSPYAAAVFAKLWPAVMPHVTITSAGFVGPGRGSPEPALSAARRRGIDLSGHRSTLVSTQAVRGAELAIVMSATQSRALRRVGGRQSNPLILGDLDPEPILTRTIVDPWGEADEVFDESYERIDRCVRELIREMTSTLRQEANRE